MLGIYYLKLTQKAFSTGSRIHDHYILMSKSKFFVMTSNPPQNMKTSLISNFNIKGENKNQYVVEHIHHFDPTKHLISVKTEAINYFAVHQEKFSKVLELLNQSN